MNFEKGLKPDNRLRELAKQTAETQARLKVLGQRIKKQSAVCEQLSTEIADIAGRKSWENARTDAEIKKGLEERERVKALGERLKQENKLLAALEDAARKVRQDGSTANKQIERATNNLLRETALDAWPKIEKAFMSVLSDYRSYWMALHGPHVGAEKAEFEIVQILRSQRLYEQDRSRMHTARKALIEAAGKEATPA